MSARQLARIEKGERSVCKNMRDRLLGRLGISSDLYENLLDIEDYAAWEQQRNILCAVEQKAFQNAQELIAKYEEQGSRADKIKQQFCLVMQAEILRQQGADEGEIGACYEKAVRLTVPDAGHLCTAHKLLAIQEINMILEYEFYHRRADFAQKCRDLMTFVEHSVYDELSKVKIYPKIAYYYLQEMTSQENMQDSGKLEESLEICNRAVEMLRDTGRAYFLLELLEMKIRIVENIKRLPEECGKLQVQNALEEELRECVELAELLKKLYKEYEVPAYMQDCAYLYQQRWVFYVGDVLRIRRKMYGLTQEELCGGDCSARTLRRTEKKESSMQYVALSTLLRKLGLSKEYQRARLVSNDREVLRLMEELTTCRNNRELEKAKTILNQMKERVLDEVPENRQYIMEAEASLDWLTGAITEEEFAAREEEALRCTLKVDDLYQMDEVYLTEMEMLCIRQRIQVLPEIEKRKCIDFLLQYFEGYENKNELSDCIAIYEFAALCVICELGNLREHKQSITQTSHTDWCAEP
ncbi:MAG: hypothetical protein K2P40_08695 [Lachnospiraceae bacterium]|nr:hypothetical protein [Lachnospiraceae bacterium]